MKEFRPCCQSEQRGIILLFTIPPLSSILSRVSWQLYQPQKTVLNQKQWVGHRTESSLHFTYSIFMPVWCTGLFSITLKNPAGGLLLPHSHSDAVWFSDTSTEEMTGGRAGGHRDEDVEVLFGRDDNGVGWRVLSHYSQPCRERLKVEEEIFQVTC